ncbi:hypothetical protein M5D96_007566 [Drosophila gunungcola]|uniref:Uncharacterized protein n=1 Tax=Drosophila gunungcola TaxID=103775 RepID=A0A9P9YNE5_9MUSC|nr:hypothetical protein M5D96_007566 [Drosophila gunungcola]
MAAATLKSPRGGSLGLSTMICTVGMVHVSMVLSTEPVLMRICGGACLLSLSRPLTLPFPPGGDDGLLPSSSSLYSSLSRCTRTWTNVALSGRRLSEWGCICWSGDGLVTITSGAGASAGRRQKSGTLVGCSGG